MEKKTKKVAAYGQFVLVLHVNLFAATENCGVKRGGNN